MKATLSIGSLALLACTASAAVSPWGQCGGNGHSGETTCTSGHSCVVVNEWYHQCQPGGSAPTTSQPPVATTRTTTATQPTASSPVGSICPGAVTGFKYFGVNQAGAEFGEKKIPGVLGTDYTWPEPSSIDYFVNNGMNTFRVPFLLERLSPLAQGMTGSFDQTYLNSLKQTVNYITGKGAYAVIEPHNYMRYNGNIITDYNAFATWWRNLANEFKSNSRVIFDIINEPYGVDASAALALNQAAVNSIRGTGASQLILVEGTSWTGAHSWISSGNAAAFVNIKDPGNNIAIEMHQYLDSDSSGTSGTCVSASIGRERLAAASAWLKQNNFKGFLGEMGAGSNPTCIEAVKGALCSLLENGQWIGFTWWAAGPWWGSYFQSLEPPSGPALAQVFPQAIKPFSPK